MKKLILVLTLSSLSMFAFADHHEEDKKSDKPMDHKEHEQMNKPKADAKQQVRMDGGIKMQNDVKKK